MDRINSTTLYLISGILSIILFFFYLYIHRILSIRTKINPIPIQWHAKWDWVLVLLVIIIAVVMGFKLITLMVVVSDSMVPEFARGDIIISQSFDLAPQVGDIITFTTPEVLTAVTHRVVRIDGDRIRTKGDNSLNIDYFKTTQPNIIGKAIQFNGHPIVIKGVGALFIVDYTKQGTISRFGDTFTFMQQLSAAISAWGLTITIIAFVLLVSNIKR